MNGGVYFFKKKILNLIKNKPQSLEDDILPNLIKRRKICGKLFNDFFTKRKFPELFSETFLTSTTGAAFLAALIVSFIKLQ